MDALDQKVIQLLKQVERTSNKTVTKEEILERFIEVPKDIQKSFLYFFENIAKFPGIKLKTRQSYGIQGVYHKELLFFGIQKKKNVICIYDCTGSKDPRNIFQDKEPKNPQKQRTYVTGYNSELNEYILSVLRKGYMRETGL